MKYKSNRVLGFCIGICLIAQATSILSACSSSKDDQNLCEQVTCSGRGTCDPEAEPPGCICDPGFTVSGPYCVKSHRLIILQTNDRHSHWLGQNNCDHDPQAPGDGTRGGAARWVPIIRKYRETHQNVLVLDAGDFTMGTLLVSAQNHAADLNLMKEIGFDAAALGNHEFDWGLSGFTNMLNQTITPAVPLLCANLTFDPNDPKDDGLADLYGEYTDPQKLIYPYMVFEMPGGFRVGVFGLLGMSATLVINSDPVTFSKSPQELVHRAQMVVDELRDHQHADVVILLGHLGLNTDLDTVAGETALLARRVRGIDAILSGHYHTATQPVEITYEGDGIKWTTLAMEAGSYGRYLGKYELVLNPDGKSATAELIPVTDQLEGDLEILEQIDLMVSDVEENILSSFPTRPDPGAFLDGDFYQILTTSSFDLNRHMYENNNLGYLMADALAEATGAQVAAIGNSNDLRSSLERCQDGSIDLSDFFNTIPLGFGSDGLPGVPAVMFMLRWADLKTIFEYTIADWGRENNDFMINISGLRIQLDSRNDPMTRITRIVQYDPADEGDSGNIVYQTGTGSDGWLTEPSNLVRIATSYSSAMALELFPLVALRDENGNILKDLTSRIVFDTHNREQKCWYLAAQKLSGFESQIPDQYNDAPDRNPYGPHWRRACDLNPNALPAQPCRP